MKRLISPVIAILLMPNSLVRHGDVLGKSTVAAHAADSVESSERPAAGGVRYLSSSEVQAAFEKGSPLIDKDGRSYGLLAGRRDKPGQSELHAKDTDIFYVLEGSATFVTGGTMVDPKTTTSGEVRGSAISGGDSRVLSKGDVIIIPAGIPHWFKDVQGIFLYFVVKVQGRGLTCPSNVASRQACGSSSARIWRSAATSRR